MSDNPDHMDLLEERQSLRELLEEIREFLIDEGYTCETDMIGKIDLALDTLGYSQ
jgi:hypothetical protein